MKEILAIYLSAPVVVLPSPFSSYHRRRHLHYLLPVALFSTGESQQHSSLRYDDISYNFFPTHHRPYFQHLGGCDVGEVIVGRARRGEEGKGRKEGAKRAANDDAGQNVGVK